MIEDLGLDELERTMASLYGVPGANHFSCQSCGRLCSVPWEAAWCMHHERTLPHPPEWVDSDWERMLPVTNVETATLPPEAEEWYVTESRNPYGYPNDEIPGDDKATWKVIAGPLSREDAYALAESHPRDDVPAHIHSFRALPGDLIEDRTDG